MSTGEAIDLSSLDTTKACEEGFEFEYIRGTGQGTNIFITVIGDHAPKVREWTRKQINQLRRQEALAKKRGKDSVRDVESDEEFYIHQTALKIVSWRGIKDECNLDNCIRLCTINPEIRVQVNEAAGELANFTKG